MNTAKSKEVQPYLFFNGRCEEALEFYKKAIGAEVLMMSRFKESPEPASCPGANPESIMHAAFKVGSSTVMASDGMGKGPLNFEGFSLSLTPPDAAEAEKLFKALGEGGKVQMPLGKTFYSPAFGMVEDRFGVSWMIYVAA